MIEYIPPINDKVPGLVEVLERFDQTQDAKTIDNLSLKTIRTRAYSELGLITINNQFREFLTELSSDQTNYRRIVSNLVGITRDIYLDPEYEGDYVAPDIKTLINPDLLKDDNNKEIFDQEMTHLGRSIYAVKDGLSRLRSRQIGYLLRPKQKELFNYSKDQGVFYEGIPFCVVDPDLQVKRVFYAKEIPQEGCFLVTATLESQGLPRNCSELEEVRAFRELHLRGIPGFEETLAEYYSLAPEAIKAVRVRPDSQIIFDNFWKLDIQKILKAVKDKDIEFILNMKDPIFRKLRSY